MNKMLCRYRNVEIKGDLVIGEMQCDWPGRPDRDPTLWTKFRGSEQMMKIQHAWETGGPELGEALLTLADGAERTGVFRTADGWRAIVNSSEFSIYAMVQVAEEWWAGRLGGQQTSQETPWPWQEPDVQKA